MADLEIVKNNVETFIMPFQVSHTLCDELINHYKNTKYNKIDASDSGWSPDVKQSVDLTIRPSTDIQIINDYLDCITDGLDMYFKQYPESYHLIEITEPFNIQYYPSGGGFKKWHCERDTQQTFQRSLVFMTYLNDIPDGVGTAFKFYPDVKIKAKKGLSLIWPTDFTHTHRGVVSEYEKYIVTGWINHASVKTVHSVAQKEIHNLTNEIQSLRKKYG